MSGIESAKTNKLLFHLTKVDNFRSIVREGLLPRRVIEEKRIGFSNVADKRIIEKRTIFDLDCYVPFHFHPYSAFDVVVKNTYDAKRMIYLCIYRDYARAKGYKILPMHPLSMENCQLYEYDEGFEQIDWDTLTRKNDPSEYAKEVKMAECLTDHAVFINELASIFVPSIIIKNEIIRIMEEEGVQKNNQPIIYEQPIWFDNYGSEF